MGSRNARRSADENRETVAMTIDANLARMDTETVEILLVGGPTESRRWAMRTRIAE
jgi:hypothetical protein